MEDGQESRSSFPGYRNGYNTALESIMFRSDFYSTNICIDDQVSVERDMRERSSLDRAPSLVGKMATKEIHIEKVYIVMREDAQGAMKTGNWGRGN